MKTEVERKLDELRTLVLQSTLNSDDRDELHDALEKLADSLDDDSVNSSQLASGIYDRVLDFQQSHPVLTKTVNQVADTLSQMGI